MLDEPYQCLVADIIRVLGRKHLDPTARVGRVLPGPDLRERAVDHETAGGSPVGDHQGLQVGVDPVGECEDVMAAATRLHADFRGHPSVGPRLPAGQALWHPVEMPREAGGNSRLAAQLVIRTVADPSSKYSNTQ